MPRFDPNKSPAYVMFFAALISAAFTAAIMALHVSTAPIVERNEQVLRQKALVDVFNLGDVETLSDNEIIDLYEKQIVRVPLDQPGPQEGMAYYFAFQPGEEGTPFAYAFPVAGVGFWAPIVGVLSVEVDTQKALGVVFLRHSETPGLGGRITETPFRSQFPGLDLSPPAEGDPYIYIGGAEPTGPNDPRFDRQVDAISGATGTSTAVGRFMNTSIRRYMPEAQRLAGQSRAALETLAEERHAGTE